MAGESGETGEVSGTEETAAFKEGGVHVEDDYGDHCSLTGPQ